MMKILEETVESEIEGSSGENATERNTPNRLADVVPDVVYEVTPLKFQFLAPRMEIKKTAIILGAVWISPGSYHKSVHVTKTLR